MKSSDRRLTLGRSSSRGALARRVALGAAMSTVVLAVALGGNGASASVPTADSPGLAAAKRQLASSSTIPLTIPKPMLAAPLPKAPPKGKKAFNIGFPSANGARIANAWKAAVTALGWEANLLTWAAPSDGPGLVRQAIAQGANYISYSAISYTVMAPAIAEAAAAGIPVFETFDLEAPKGAVNNLYSNTGGTEQYINKGKLMADWVIVNSKGNANTLLVNLPQYGTITVLGDSFRAEYAKNCPGCALDTLNVTSADAVNGNLVKNSVAYLRSHPAVNNIVFARGTDAIPFPQAAVNAGITLGNNGVVISSGTPDDGNLKLIANGTQGAAIAFPLEQSAWMTVDAMARHSVGSSLVPNWKSTVPQYVQTPKNTTATTPLFSGPTNFTGQFKKLWRVS